MTNISSTEFLQFIVKHDCLLLFEKAVPVGRLKRDFISLVDRDGRAMSLTTPSGFYSSHLELPCEVFDDFVAASFIEQDRPEDREGWFFFRVSKDGRNFAASSDASILPRKAF
jgi:hypothetical protein